MRRFRISDFGLRIGAALCLLAPAALPASETRTPTPAPKLSGGFGRPRATPPPTPSVSDGGQSLADVVHAARESREGPPTEKSGLTINNRSLVRSSEKGRLSTSKPAAGKRATTPAVGAPATSPSGDRAEPTPPSTAASTGGTEAEWRDTAARARMSVADAKARVAELDAAAKKLENDFYAWDDGQYRDRVIKPSWDRARSELETARQDLATAEKELAELPEKARKAGALPGWIRE